MLIGADVPEMFCVGNIRKGLKGTPYAIKSVPNSKEDRAAYNVMESRLCLDGGHYQLPLLWKDECQKQLPDNLPLARKRLFNLKN